MPTLELIAIVAGALLAAGYAAVAWLSRGRDPGYTDDASVLMPAPPPGMTAATATIVDEGPTHLAFMAALLDLASRDEIAFQAEARDRDRVLVGIAIHGGESADPAVRINRRQPIGEGETWLLAQLRLAHLAADHQLDRSGPGVESLPPVEAIQVASRMMATLLQASSGAGDLDDSAAARAAREHGLMQGPADLDPDAIARAYEARTGKPMPERSRERFRQVAAAMQVFSDPASIARDPDAAIRTIEAQTGEPLSPEHAAELRQWAAAQAAPSPVPLGSPASPADPGGSPAAAPAYIPARLALGLDAPLLFGTFVQSYATRHGWLAGLPLLRRLRWRLTAILEVVGGLGLAWLGATLSAGSAAELLVGGGIGVAIGGLLTWLVAPAMASRTREGAVMKAQLAAYRRSLHLTFSQAPSMEAAVTSSGLRWLETPDQALVWGIALGLRADIEALLVRTAADLRQGGHASPAYAPGWFTTAAATRALATTEAGPTLAGRSAVEVGSPPGAPPGPAGSIGGAGAFVPGAPSMPVSLVDPAAMFAGIESIGSRPGQRV